MLSTDGRIIGIHPSPVKPVRFAHRVAFNCDLFLTIVTDSPDTPLDDLEKAAVARLQRMGSLDVTDTNVTIGLGASVDDDGLGEDSAVYPRVDTQRVDDDEIRLENFSSENCEEIDVSNG